MSSTATCTPTRFYVKDLPEIQQAGFLATAKWVEHNNITDDNLLAVGQELFKFQCSACHSIGGPLNDIRPLAAKYDSTFGMDAKLNGLGKMNNYMPPFAGTREERWALANYIVHGADIRPARNITAQGTDQRATGHQEE